MAALVAGADLVVPSPGVPLRHPLLATAGRAAVPVRSEIDLAAELASTPIVAVTGTNGKTTVTTLVAGMLRASGVKTAVAGNIGRPLLDAVRDDVDVVVAEVSSFQLHFTAGFRPRVAVLLNVAEDHLDWHGSLEAYQEAKARVFANQRGEDVLVANIDDAVVARLAGDAPARLVSFSVRGATEAGWTVARGQLVGPEGEELAQVDELPARAPHDLANALAAAAAATELGATTPGVREALADFPRLPHRVQLVGKAGGVRYYDDSKATNPHATRSAVEGFEHVVLIAGGRNKDLDLSVLRTLAPRLRAVIAMGEAAAEVEASFEGVTTVARAGSMEAAVRLAASHAEQGDAVLLSPACASLDRYSSYAARGDDFTHEVARLAAGEPA